MAWEMRFERLGGYQDFCQFTADHNGSFTSLATILVEGLELSSNM